MSNMAYCRFRNTLPDLQDCYEALKDRFLDNQEDQDPEEYAAAIAIIAVAREIAESYGRLLKPKEARHS